MSKRREYIYVNGVLTLHNPVPDEPYKPASKIPLGNLAEGGLVSFLKLDLRYPERCAEELRGMLNGKR